MKTFGIVLALYLVAVCIWSSTDADVVCDDTGCRVVDNLVVPVDVVIDETNTPLADLENPDISADDLTSDSTTPINPTAPRIVYSGGSSGSYGHSYVTYSTTTYQTPYRTYGSNGGYGQIYSSDGGYGHTYVRYSSQPYAGYGNHPYAGSAGMTYGTYSHAAKTYNRQNPRLAGWGPRRRLGFGFGVFRPLGFFRRF